MNEQDIPITINQDKLVDFLLTRRLVNKNWPNGVRAIRDQIANAVNDMPEHPELVRLLSGAHINYFHCVQILDILKKTEADTKNVFGRYSSQRYTNWQDIIKAYERDSVYIAEAAQIYTRNVNYEIPGLKRQIAHAEKLEEEAHKKVNDLNKSENILKNEYSTICEQFKIKGDDIEKDLVENLTELQKFYSKISETVPPLTKAVHLYSIFASNSDILPVIRHIAKYGNTTVYQFIYGEAPLSVEEPELKIQIDSAPMLDLGEAIDFGEEEVNLEVGDIDWGAVGDVEPEIVEPDAIDFNVSLEESGIVVEADGCSGGVAKGDEAYTLLDSPKYRELFLDELYELEAFLKLRLFELSNAGKHQIMSLNSVENFADHDAQTVLEMLSYVEIVITAGTNETLYHLHQIKHSPNYVNILTAKLKQRLAAIEKVNRTREMTKAKAAEYHQESLDLRPQLTRLVEQTKVLQLQIEKDISKRYKNRIVNITGANFSI